MSTLEGDSNHQAQTPIKLSRNIPLTRKNLLNSPPYNNATSLLYVIDSLRSKKSFKHHRKVDIETVPLPHLYMNPTHYKLTPTYHKSFLLSKRASRGILRSDAEEESII